MLKEVIPFQKVDDGQVSYIPVGSSLNQKVQVSLPVFMNLLVLMCVLSAIGHDFFATSFLSDLIALSTLPFD